MDRPSRCEPRPSEEVRRASCNDAQTTAVSLRPSPVSFSLPSRSVLSRLNLRHVFNSSYVTWIRPSSSVNNSHSLIPTLPSIQATQSSCPPGLPPSTPAVHALVRPTAATLADHLTPILTEAILTDQNGMRTIEIDGLGMKGKEGRMIMVDAVEVEVQTTVRYSSFTSPFLSRRCELIPSFLRSWQKTSEVDIPVGPR